MTDENNSNYKQIGFGILRGSLSLVPGGSVINEIFDTRSRIVSDRINDFIKEFIKYANDLGVSMEEGAVQSEEFNDLFIAVMAHVANIKSKEKRKVFRDILLFNIQSKYHSDFYETFLDIAHRLDYVEIEILKLYKSTGRSGNLDFTEENEIGTAQLTVGSYKDQILEIIKSYFPDLTAIERLNKYEFYMADLESKILLMNGKKERMTWADLDSEPFHKMYITAFGKEFLRFILADG